MNPKLNPALDPQLFVSAQVISQDVAGETILLDLAGEGYFGLDEVGTCRQQTAGLLNEYAVEASQLQSDITELVGQLLEEGLLVAEVDRALIGVGQREGA
jgi:hypothetical protein